MVEALLQHQRVISAQIARERFNTCWIKLEVMGHADILQPDPFALVEAARTLWAEGVEVFPYAMWFSSLL